MDNRIFVSTRLIMLVVSLCISTLATAQPRDYNGYQVVLVECSDTSELEKVQDLQTIGHDFQVWSEVLKLGTVEARVSPTGLAALQKSGLHFTVKVKDLQHYLDQLYAGEKKRAFFDSLRTYNEHVQFMIDLVNAYPNLAHMISLGQSVQGRDLWALRITGPDTVKPAVFYHGAEHGNEQATSSIVAYLAHYLLTNYATDAQVKTLVDQVEWYLLPIMNPDGYVEYDRYNANYVDLNRNWDGPGSGNDYTGGDYPFSEPETAALRDFLLAHPTVRVHVDLHGYVPWIMWVWGHTSALCDDHARFLGLGTEFRDRIVAAGGGTYSIGTIYNVAYYVSGSSTNYSYDELGVWAFGIEVNDDDMPDICEEFLNSLLFLGQWIRATDCNGNGTDDPLDISSGTSLDTNNNAIPDECEGLPVPTLSFGPSFLMFCIFSGLFLLPRSWKWSRGPLTLLSE